VTAKPAWLPPAENRATEYSRASTRGTREEAFD
jgi:hypothetical protein